MISRLLGLLRDRLIAGTFGAGIETDAYFSAFRIPDTLFSLLVLGALSSAMVPVMTRYIAKQQESEAFHIVQTLLTASGGILAVLAAVVAVCAYPISFLVIPADAPAWTPADRDLFVYLMRILLLSPIFLGISNVMAGVVHTYQRFLSIALAPIVYNAGIIAGILLIAPVYGIEGVAWGVVVGSVLHATVQSIAAVRAGFRPKMVLHWRHEGVRNVLRLLGPRVVGMIATQASLFVTIFLANGLSEGSAAHFSFADNLYAVPIGVFAISIAVASFPKLAKAASQNDEKAYESELAESFIRISFWVFPSAVLIWVLRDHLVRMAIGTGSFDWESTLVTADLIGWLAFGLVAQGLAVLLVRAFYALQDTRTPVLISVISMAVSVLIMIWLRPYAGVAALAIGTSVGWIMNMALLLVVLRRRIGPIHERQFVPHMMALLIATVVSAAVGWGGLRWLNHVSFADRFVEVVVQAIVVAGVTGLVYLAVIRLFGFNDVKYLLTALRRVPR